MQLFSLIIWFAKFTDPISDVAEICRISVGYSPSGLRFPAAGRNTCRQPHYYPQPSRLSTTIRGVFTDTLSKHQHSHLSYLSRGFEFLSKGVVFFAGKTIFFATAWLKVCLIVGNARFESQVHYQWYGVHTRSTYLAVAATNIGKNTSIWHAPHW